MLRLTNRQPHGETQRLTRIHATPIGAFVWSAVQIHTCAPMVLFGERIHQVLGSHQVQRRKPDRLEHGGVLLGQAAHRWL